MPLGFLFIQNNFPICIYIRFEYVPGSYRFQKQVRGKKKKSKTKPKKTGEKKMLATVWIQTKKPVYKQVFLVKQRKTSG